MEPVYLITALIGTPLILAALTAALPTPAPATDEDPTTLTYCLRCGCRHRVAYMTWDSDGNYRCNICCVEVPR